MARYANKYRGKESEFKIGDKVLLDARNYEITKKSRKLADRNIGPFEIIKQHGKVNYELNYRKL